MSIQRMNPLLQSFRSDGHISLNEAKTLACPNNGIGKHFDSDEFEVVRRLVSDIDKGTLAAKPVDDQLKILNDKHQARLVDRGVRIGASVAGGLIAAIGLISAVSSASLGAAIPAILFGGPVAMGVIIGIAALGGLIHSKISPVKAEDVQNNTEKAQAAMNFEKDPQTEAGLQKGGIAGGIFSGLWGGGTLVGAAGYAMQNLTSVGFGGAIALYGLFTVLPVGAAVGALCGVGALVGHLVSRSQDKRLEETPSGAVTADAEAKKFLEDLLKKGTDAEEPVRDNAKSGAKIGGIVGGIGATGALALGTATIATNAGAALTFLGIAAPVAGLGVMAAAGIGAGIGALVGWNKSKDIETID